MRSAHYITACVGCCVRAAETHLQPGCMFCFLAAFLWRCLLGAGLFRAQEVVDHGQALGKRVAVHLARS
jgi:hypothetical protein